MFVGKYSKKFQQLRPDIAIESGLLNQIKSIRKPDFNGREIRNIFQTSVALAQQGGDGRMILSYSYVKRAVALSRVFHEYMDKT
jgi:hypothetical protein